MGIPKTGPYARFAENPHRSDFELDPPRKPFRMYHGTGMSGFPQHPHRGMETFTMLLEGTVDHTDSLGSSGRYSGGDAQWMCAGRGIVHGEMFPLVHTDRPNTLRLFQLWLNLPAADKGAEPGYTMQWGEKLTKVAGTGGAVASVFAGRLGDAVATITPPPASWGAKPENDVGAFVIELPAGSTFVVPPAAGGASVNRMLYVVESAPRGVTVGGRATSPSALTVRPDAPIELVNVHGTEPALVLVLQGKPIGEPVAKRGPFVANSDAELASWFAEYRRTHYGGWPWPSDAPYFPRDKGRFGSHGRGLPDELPPAV